MSNFIRGLEGHPVNNFLKSSKLYLEKIRRVQTIIGDKRVLIFVGLRNGNGMIQVNFGILSKKG